MPLELAIYQVDAFAEAPFTGNPAAVVPLPRWLPDAVLQAIAAENNLAETAFLVEQGEGYALRWFTPAVEVELCGHATLAAAFVVLEFLKRGRERIAFATRCAGPLSVTRAGDRLTLDLPARPPERVPAPAGLAEALGTAPLEVWQNRKLLAIFATESEVRALRPDFRRVALLDGDGVIASAPGGNGTDFVSRYFAPHAGIDEDPVTGSAHCVLVPYWARRLGKARLAARQVSARGGTLGCEDRGARVALTGAARLYLVGTIFVPS